MSRQIVRFALAGILAGLVAGAAAQETDGPSPAHRTAADSVALRPGDKIRIDFSQTPFADGDRYVIEAGDDLRLTISSGETSSAEDARVMPDGWIAIDPVGTTPAAGRTVDQLVAELRAALESKGLRQPRVTISVIEPHGIARGFLDGLRDGSTFRMTVQRGVDLHLPGIGPIPMPGDLDALQRELVEAYAARFGSGLTVSASIEQRVPPVVYVTGDVQAPGPYPWTEGMTPFIAIAQAGGFTATSDLSTVMVVKNTAGSVQVTTLDFSPLLRNEMAKPRPTLDADDVIVVPFLPALR